MKNVLVTGADGQLGSCLRDRASLFPEFKFHFSSISDLDITSEESIDSFVQENEIDAILNCAAYTAVDKAEEEKEKAFEVNAHAINHLIKAASKRSARIIHISTDYVFSGVSEYPYSVDEEKGPINVYGSSKLAGEENLEKYQNSILIRTSWVISEYGNNFVKTMKRLGAERNELNVVSDQIGAPTYAGDLAMAILTILKRNKALEKMETYHYSNAGKISWHTLAEAIMQIEGLACEVHPIPTSEYPTPAKRPSYSLLSCSKIVQDYGISIPFWRDSLKKILKRLSEE